MFGIFTGSNDVTFHFLVGMLRSLRVYNDLDLPVIVLDFGMSSAQRELILSSGWRIERAVASDPLLLDAQARLQKRHGDKGKHLGRILSKLFLCEQPFFDRFVWIDADTILL